MINRVIQLLEEGKSEEALKALKDPDYIYLIWNTEDVLSCAEEMGVKISKKKAREILHKLDHYHDASTGVNWETIETHIHMRNRR